MSKNICELISSKSSLKESRPIQPYIIAEIGVNHEGSLDPKGPYK